MKSTILLTLSFFVISCAPVAPSPQAPAEETPAPQTGSNITGVHFGAERVSATSMRLSLDNGAQQAIGYNLCNSELQRRTGSDWARVPSDTMCTMQLMTLNPGHDATFEKDLPAGLEAGEYRFVTSIENPLEAAPAAITTDSFVVR
jgi:hypothetical protein